MILKNKTTGKTICADLKIASSSRDRMFGLLIPTNPRNLLFKTRFGVHTFFLKEPIDVLVLDPDMRVVKLRQSLMPNSLFFWNPKFSSVVELPKSTIKKFNIQVNDRLALQDSP